MSVPNAYTTEPVWDLWLGAKAAISGVKLGGVYADKPGYHNTRKANKSKWPSNYSIQLDLDKQGPSDKAAALDLTMSTANMKKYTKRLKAAMLAGDSRMRSVKEFYGTLDGDTVYGLGKKSRNGDPYKTSADSSHLWHIHLSFFRADVDDHDRIMAVLDVLTGKAAASTGTSSGSSSGDSSTSDWDEEIIMALPTVSDNTAPKAARKRVQSLLAAAGYPPANTFDAKGRPDGDFGSGSKTALGNYQKAVGLDPDKQCGKKTWTKLLTG